MRQFFERCEDLWMAQPPPADWLKHFRSETQAVLFPSNECAELRTRLERARALAKSEKVRQRVEFVSAAFGATERFVAFCEAKAVVSRWTVDSRTVDGRTVDSRTVDNGRSDRRTVGLELLTALERYLRAKTEFVDCMKRLEQTQPLAIYSGKLDDFLCTDPAYDAALTLLESGTVMAPGQLPAVEDAAVQDAISRWQDGLTDASRERLRSPSFEGEITPGLRIAGLQYRADITTGWDSRVEPAENAVAAVTAAAARTGSGGLRLANHKYASVFAWSPMPQARGFEVAAYLRGRLSSSARVMLTVSWLDASQKIIDSRRVRFIPTSTTAWTRLRVGQTAPADAAWVGVGISVAYQLPGDWVDVDDVSLRPWEMK
jgi:hypothetical protein